ncbi:hypothetical protein E2C01_090636 [Portunus trituberculatus]|uniref:Uncharacterized protein n=1 Tax=Portunus trituberculatus TaxID=210409 RepID=A0A5B7JLE4_PORTR|nr:hypothetical protein [Portunus trituberculatus]
MVRAAAASPQQHTTAGIALACVWLASAASRAPPMLHPPSPETLPTPPLENNCRRRRWRAGGGPAAGREAPRPSSCTAARSGGRKLRAHLWPRHPGPGEGGRRHPFSLRFPPSQHAAVLKN